MSTPGDRLPVATAEEVDGELAGPDDGAPIPALAQPTVQAAAGASARRLAFPVAPGLWPRGPSGAATSGGSPRSARSIDRSWSDRATFLDRATSRPPPPPVPCPPRASAASRLRRR
ncbi:MAG TPA: hypothetical protein VGV36_01785, partial [Solirubrobacteraceae bacterium]|nr:hypothetical protein [Solirubrobacteraceae bacterium]